MPFATKRLLPETVFNSGQLTDNLALKSIRGGISTVLSQSVLLVIYASGVMILARLLTPRDYGIFGMAAGAVGFFALVKDAGLSAVTIQKETVSREQVSNLFWLNSILGTLMGGLVLLSSPLIAAFFNRPEIAKIAALMSVSFVISGLMVQHEALLRRHMRFDSLALVQILSQLVGQGVTVALALMGWHYWALVVGSICALLVSALATFWFCPWLPGFMSRGSGVRKMLKFGRDIVGFNFTSYFSKTADKMMIGKFIGADGLGLYSTAYTLFMMPITRIHAPMVQVAMPVLSSLQSQPKRYFNYYRRLVDIMMSVIAPVSLYCAVEAEFVIAVLLGPQWAAAVPIFRVLVVCSILQTVVGAAGLVQLSRGNSRRYFYWGGVNAVVLFLSVLAGLPFGIKGVAASYTLANILLFFPTLIYCLRGSPVGVSGVLGAIKVPLAIGLTAFFSVYVVKMFVPIETAFSHVLMASLFSAVVLVLSIIRKTVRETISMALNSGFADIFGGSQSRNAP